MSFVIPDEFLEVAHISEADLKLEIAILLVQQEKIEVDTASRFAGIEQLEFQRILGDRQFTITNDNKNVWQDLATPRQWFRPGPGKTFPSRNPTTDRTTPNLLPSRTPLA